jgi:glycine reductase complex component B subunit gamma
MRVVHYLNQFFGGLGGEEKAEASLEARDGAIGPGKLRSSCLAPKRKW